MSVIDCVTRLLDGHRLHDIKIEFSIMGESSSAYITAQDEAGIDIDVYYDDMKLIIKQSKISLNNRDQWEQLSRAVGWSKSIREIILKEKVEIHHSVVGAHDDDRVDRYMSSEAYDYIETFYRGLELNSSIQNLEIDMDLFPSRGAFPTFNIQSA
eukprot:scaffold88768_cov71-Cyclotella_meneghiniana.AAC.5